jgi:arylsulfatase A-like enzyme
MSRKPNILFIAVDTLRADHLGCYGYERDTSPRIDALADEGVVCERLFCTGIPTHPSFTTFYTGQHPITHNIVSHGGRAELARDTPTLPELLLQAGYTTCAVDNLWRVRSWFGRGYEFCIDPSVRRGLTLAVSCEELNGRAIPWLRAHADEPFFLFIHYWDPHYPLNPPARYRDLFYTGDPVDPTNHSLDAWWHHPLGALARDTWLRRPEGRVTDADFVIALFDQEIRHLDDGIRELLGALDELGLAEETLVVFVADHGTSLTEHGIFFDHHGLYDNTIRVPLILRWPGRLPQGVRLPHMLDTDALAPTLLEAAGSTVPNDMEGPSFWKLITGEEEDGGCDRIISLECTWQAKWSLRTEQYKLILSRDSGLAGGPPRELYDLSADPDEERSLVGERPELADSMESELEGWIADRLRALGKQEDPLVEQGISLRHLVSG